MPKKTKPYVKEITSEVAREFLVGHHGLKRITLPAGRAGVVSALHQLRCIQLDPLDVLGTNADVVAMARVDGLTKGEVYQALYPGHAFEHFAKERCLLPAHHFPWYRAQATETPWWRLSERKKRVPTQILRKVLEEIHARGPLTARELTQHGKVIPLDWNGWAGTSNATSMALEILWTQCKIVVCGRSPGGKIYDIPERALPGHHSMKDVGSFERWALLERVEAAGLLARNSGPHWSMLSKARTSQLPEDLIQEGLIEEIKVQGSSLQYLAPTKFLERIFPAYDDRMRILAPLDSLIWDRELVRQAFGFDYVWEVYKPAHQRKWGWYVYPLLHRGRLVGRMEGVIEKNTLKVTNLWKESGVAFDRGAFGRTLQRHAEACGAQKVSLKTSKHDD